MNPTQTRPPRPKHYRMCVFLLFALVLSGCCGTCYVRSPDTDRFRAQVASHALRDSLEQGLICPGMPYWVVTDIFRDCGSCADTGLTVASVGSTQVLGEMEGLGRKYEDDAIGVLMDIIDTEQGELRIWYKRMDFYRARVEAGDVLNVYAGNTRYSVPIRHLIKPEAFVTARASAESLPPRQDSLYAEIVSAERTTTSYWYTLKHLGNAVFQFEPVGFDRYPIIKIALNGNNISSFRWQVSHENK